MNPEYLNTLNPMQRQAVELGSVNSLILAGAGSGKTKVLTTRIAWLLTQQLAWPSQILAVTFTNKAAREMRTRLESMVNFDIKSMWIGTFHGICHRILRLHAQEANLPPTFQIIDSSDQLSLIRRIMKDAGIDIELYNPKSFQASINRFKEAGLRASDVMSEENEMNYGLYRAYEGRCQREGLVDFAELLLRCVELLEHNALLREHYAERFRYILVDEFQDTNVLQYRWIKALSKPGVDKNCVFCVGDDDQSIYAFRGACVGNMAEFVRDYGVGSIIKLEQNYRSTSHILDAANAVISNNDERMGKNLWTDTGSGELIDLYNAQSDRDEARSITQDILTLTRSALSSSLKYRDIAVLYRNNSQSRLIEQYLIANSIPYRIYGGLRFFDRAGVKDVTAYLRVMSTPDDTSVMRVINHPPRGIGATSLERALESARASGRTLWETISACGEDKALSRTQNFTALIARMREACEGLALADTIKVVIEMSGLQAYYEAQKDKDIRLENLGEIVNAASGYYEDNDIDENAPAFDVLEGGAMTPLEGFLSQAVLEADDKNEGSEQPDAVQLMTVHASKGLEFHHVYLIGVEEGIFPHSARPDEDEAKAISEERRLMYVAMTRARRKLRISWCAQRQMYGDLRCNDKSRFIDEIPSEHIRELNPAPKAGSFRDEARARAYAANYGYGRQWSENSGYAQKRSSGWNTSSYASSGRSGGYRKPPTGASAASLSSDAWKKAGVRKASDYLGEVRQTQSGLGSIKKAKAVSVLGFTVGDAVEHERFGLGRIEKITYPEKLDQTRIMIRFAGEEKSREMLLAFVADKMKKVSS